MKVKLLADLMDFYRATSESGTVDPKHLKAVSSKNSLIFGPWSPPRLIAGREGRVTPVRYGEQNRMVMWRTINLGKNIIGGVMVIWPLRKVSETFPLQFALEDATRSSGRILYPLLTPLAGLSNDPRRILPRTTAQLVRERPRSFERLCEIIHRVKRGRTVEHEGFFVFREYFSMEQPYDMVAIAPVPTVRTPVAGLLTAYRSLFILFWGLVFSYVGASGRPPPLSLRAMFRVLFLLVASLPLGMLVTFGYLQISSETQRAIEAVEMNAVDTLNSLDIQSQHSLVKFSRCAQKAFSSPSFIRNVTTLSPLVFPDVSPVPRGSDTVALAARECFAIYQAAGEPLEDVQIFQPGRKGRAFTRGGVEISSAENLDFFAGVINLTHNSLVSGLETLVKTDIMLDTESQKSWRTIFESFGILAFNQLFFSLMEYGQMSSIGSEDIGLHVTQIFFGDGAPRAYILLHTSTKETQKNFLVRGLSRLNLRDRARYACGDVVSGGVTSYYPPPNAGYWSTEAGRILHECMDASAISDSPVTLRRGALLAVSVPCRTLGPMVTGSIWELDELTQADTSYKRLLLLFALLLGFIALMLGRLTAEHLVTPLETVEKTLKLVSTGNLSKGTGLERSDEIGRVTASFDAMIAGLRERRELGKFVSGAIDSAFDTAEIIDSHAMSVRGTVLVSDVRSFTTMSESHPPAEIVALLNTHMEAMTAAIGRHGGRVDRFIGDAVVAVFFAPGQDAGASSAVAAAIEMNAATDEINRRRLDAGTFPYGIGIGITTGELMTGSLGGARRRDFIVIGKPRQRAENLENRSKTGRHTRIILDRATAELVSATYLLEELPQESASELIGPRGAIA
ncbi:hypothetical protein KBA41_07715 [Candidatus Ozemobacteraceae bacterium]|nr:hypothetical protein [Candidatus Ozemobacteraceae bacterium]